MRLCMLDVNRVIARCYWGEDEDLKLPDVREAPDTWALEGVNYDLAKAAYEAKISAETTRLQSLQDDATRVDLIARLKAATPEQISNYVDANVTDLASARALFKRILLVLSLMVKQD